MAHRSDSSEDRITNLPSELLTIILSYLPFAEAVRTSVLSKDWVYNWLSLSTFILNSNTISTTQEMEDRKWEIVSRIVNNYLLNHTSPIKEFSLTANLGSHVQDICGWIQSLSEKNIEALYLYENVEAKFELPEILFSFKKLYKLMLRGILVKFPSDFGGLTSLRRVSLQFVAVNSDDLYRFIVCCPLLDYLELVNMLWVNVLRISAPRLRVLSIDSSVGNVVIEIAPCLVGVCVNDVRRRHEGWVVFNSYGVLSNFLGLGSIQELALSGYMIKLLSLDYGDGKFPWRNSTITHLGFRNVRFESLEVLLVCLSILFCCPNVETFNFSFQLATSQKLIAKFLMRILGKFYFPKLTKMEMASLRGDKLGCCMSLLDYISVHSPNLKFLSVGRQGGKEMTGPWISRFLTQLKITCPQAYVQYVHRGICDGDIVYYLP